MPSVVLKTNNVKDKAADTPAICSVRESWTDRQTWATLNPRTTSCQELKTTYNSLFQVDIKAVKTHQYVFCDVRWDVTGV